MSTTNHSSYVWSNTVGTGSSATTGWRLEVVWVVTNVDGDTSKLTYSVVFRRYTPDSHYPYYYLQAGVKWVVGSASGTTTANTANLTPGQTCNIVTNKTMTFSRGHSDSTKSLSCSLTLGSDFSGSKTATVTIKPVIPAKTSYAVTYDANGGSGAPSKQTKYYNENLILSSTKPTRTGYTFSKWNTEKGGGGTNYSPGGTYKSNAALALHAIWSINSYTLTFNANATGVTVSPASKSIAYGGAYGTLPTPTRTGYDFLGWYTAASGGTKVASTTTIGAGNVTVYAHWQLKTYQITYNANGGSGAPANQTKTYGVDINLQPQQPTRARYDFIGWATSSTGAAAYQPGQLYQQNAALNLYAVWQPFTCTITYDGNRPVGEIVRNIPESQTKKEGEDLKLRASVPECEGYTFAGWATSQSGQPTYQPNDWYKEQVVEDGATIVLYAQWRNNQVVITYDINGGSRLLGNTESLTQIISYNNNIILKDLETLGFYKTGYHVVEEQISGSIIRKTTWSSTDQNFTYGIDYYTQSEEAYEYQWNEFGNLNSEITNKTLYARWIQNNYTIKYKKGGRVSGYRDLTNYDDRVTGVMEDSEATYDNSFTLIKNIYERQGYEFLGWTLNQFQLTEDTTVQERKKYYQLINNEYVVVEDVQPDPSAAQYYELIIYNDEAVVINLTTIQEGIVELIPVWEQIIVIPTINQIKCVRCDEDGNEQDDGENALVEIIVNKGNKYEYGADISLDDYEYIVANRYGVIINLPKPDEADSDSSATLQATADNYDWRSIQQFDLTTDTTPVLGKTYYYLNRIYYEEVTNPQGNPQALGYYELTVNDHVLENKLEITPIQGAPNLFKIRFILTSDNYTGPSPAGILASETFDVTLEIGSIFSKTYGLSYYYDELTRAFFIIDINKDGTAVAFGRTAPELEDGYFFSSIGKIGLHGPELAYNTDLGNNTTFTDELDGIDIKTEFNRIDIDNIYCNTIYKLQAELKIEDFSIKAYDSADTELWSGIGNNSFDVISVEKKSHRSDQLLPKALYPAETEILMKTGGGSDIGKIKFYLDREYVVPPLGEDNFTETFVLSGAIKSIEEAYQTNVAYYSITYKTTATIVYYTVDESKNSPEFVFGEKSDVIYGGAYSFQTGKGVFAQDDCQAVLGKYNENKTERSLIVGNGTEAVPSNAFEVGWDGDLYMYLDLNSGSGLDYDIRQALSALGWDDCIIQNNV